MRGPAARACARRDCPCLSAVSAGLVRRARAGLVVALSAARIASIGEFGPFQHDRHLRDLGGDIVDAFAQQRILHALGGPGCFRLALHRRRSRSASACARFARARALSRAAISRTAGWRSLPCGSGSPCAILPRRSVSVLARRIRARRADGRIRLRARRAAGSVRRCRVSMLLRALGERLRLRVICAGKLLLELADALAEIFHAAALVRQFRWSRPPRPGAAVEPVVGVLDLAFVIADAATQRFDLGLERDESRPSGCRRSRSARRARARAWTTRRPCRTACARFRAATTVLTEYSSSVPRS